MNAIWIALIPACLGVVGAWGGGILAAWNARKAQELSQKHATAQSKWAKNLELRAQIYIAAVATASDYQGSLIALTVSNGNVATVNEKMQNVAALLSKLSLLASIETITAARDFFLKVAAIQGRLVTERGQLAVSAHMLEHVGDGIRDAQSRLDQILELMRQHNRAGATDQDQFDRYRREYEATRAELNGLHAERQRHHDVVTRETARLGSLLQTEIQNIVLLSDKAVLCLRSELEIPIDEAAYMRISAEALEKIKREISDPLSHAMEESSAPSMPGT